jgi:hypothetical protein
LGKTHANSNQADFFAGARKSFRQQSPERGKRWLQTGAFGRGPGEIGKFQLHEYFGDAAVSFFLCQLGHELLKKFGETFLALFQCLEIARESLFGAKRFPRPVRFDRSIVNPATKIEEFAAELSEKVD